MVVVDLDEVLELARWAVEMKSEVEVFSGLFLFFSFHWGCGQPPSYVAINKSDTEVNQKEQASQNGVGKRDVMAPPLLPFLSD